MKNTVFFHKESISIIQSLYKITFWVLIIVLHTFIGMILVSTLSSIFKLNPFFDILFSAIIFIFFFLGVFLGIWGGDLFFKNKNIFQAEINEKEVLYYIKKLGKFNTPKKYILDCENEGFEIKKGFLGRKYVIRNDIKIPLSKIILGGIGKPETPEDVDFLDLNIGESFTIYQTGIYNGQIRIFRGTIIEESIGWKSQTSITQKIEPEPLSWEESYKIGKIKI